MNYATRWSVVSLFVLLVHLPWIATSVLQAGQQDAVTTPTASSRGPVGGDAATGSAYPAPQVDEDFPPSEMPPSF